jgi:hypothetical protein
MDSGFAGKSPRPGMTIEPARMMIPYDDPRHNIRPNRNMNAG